MENRDRDKLSREESSSSSSSSEKGQVSSDSNASFDQNIEPSEKWGSEPSRRSDGSSNENIESGRSGGMTGEESDH